MQVLNAGWAVLVVASVACGTGSTTSGGALDGSSGSSGSSGGAGDGGGGDGGACAELHVGGMNDDGIGGSRQSQVAAQAVADIASASAAQISALTASCKALAVALGASTDDQTSADAPALARDKARGWCGVAIKAIGTTKAMAGGTLAFSLVPPVCKFSVDTKGACQARCSASGTCDVAANPFTCIGGNLSGGFCAGGKLGGGCSVDAKCDADCDVSVAAAAQCTSGPASAAVNGATDAAAAAKLKTAIEANLPDLVGLQAHFEAESRNNGALTAIAESVSDLKVACIPPVVTAAVNAADDVTTGASASADVVAALKQ